MIHVVGRRPALKKILLLITITIILQGCGAEYHQSPDLSEISIIYQGSISGHEQAYIVYQETEICLDIYNDALPYMYIVEAEIIDCPNIGNDLKGCMYFDGSLYIVSHRLDLLAHEYIHYLTQCGDECHNDENFRKCAYD